MQTRQEAILAVYTTEYDDTYVLETICSLDMEVLRDTISERSERIMEAQFHFDVKSVDAVSVRNMVLMWQRHISQAIKSGIQKSYLQNKER